MPDLPQPLHAGDFYLRAIREELIGLRADISALSALLAGWPAGALTGGQAADESAGAPQEASVAATAPDAHDEGSAAERPAAEPAPSAPVRARKAPAKRSTKR